MWGLLLVIVLLFFIIRSTSSRDVYVPFTDDQAISNIVDSLNSRYKPINVVSRNDDIMRAMFLDLSLIHI